MKRSGRERTEQARQRLSEMLGRNQPRPERHGATFQFRRAAISPLQSHLYFELDGLASAEYRNALSAEFERRLEAARDAAGSAFCMLGDEDRLPTMQCTVERPARVCIDIYATGGARLWAVEQLVRSCFEQAVLACEVFTRPGAAGSRARACPRPAGW